MGFFSSGKKAARAGGQPSLELLHRLECKACPLAKVEGNQHPDMQPTGPKDPIVYILGEGPGREEDQKGIQFIGSSGQLLRGRVPKAWVNEIRWNNTVRTRPYKNATPERTEIEACRPSIIADIIASKPKAIFGFGDIPLHWATGMRGIGQWRGRKTPVNIGGHVCWFYAFHHPSFLLRIRNKYATRPTDIGSEPERIFGFDLKRAFDELDELPEPIVYTAKDAEAGVELIECSASGLEKLEQLLNWAAMQPQCGVDYETFRTRPYAKDAQILSAAVGGPKHSFAFAFDHPGGKWTKAQRQRVDELWRKFLQSGTRKCSHFLNFEQEWTTVFFGADLLRAGPWADTYNQAAVLDERQGDSKPGCLSLEFLIQLYFGFNLKSLSPLNVKDLRKEPLRDVLRYNAMDAKWHERLFVAQDKLLHEQGLQTVYEADVRKIPTLVLTQVKGVPIYFPANEELWDKYEARVQEAEAKIEALPEAAAFRAKFGEQFRPSSGKHMEQMLIKILHRTECIVEDRSGTKKVTVDEAVMEQIDHPLVNWEMKRRKAQKILSTYLKAYRRDSSDVWPDGKIHPLYNQPGTVSDRTSAESPNVQNIPKRNEEAKEVRRQIRAPKGHVVVSVDYGQIQFRGIAMTSKDRKLIKYLWDRHDVHGDWAEQIAYVYPRRVGGKQFLKDKAVMKTFRTDVKNQWTFPSVFGAHIESRAEYLQIPVDDLKPLDRKFWNEFGGIAEWHERQQKMYESKGYVLGVNGRHFRGPLSRNQYINYPIQDLEAHIVVGHGFCTLSERATETGDMYYQPELEVHDDLAFMLPTDKVDDYVQQIVTDMLSVPYDYINVPLTVEVSVGDDLYSVKEVLTASSDEWLK